MDNVKDCDIINLTENNLSDHLPVQMKFTVTSSSGNSKSDVKQFIKTNWRSDINNELYNKIPTENLSEVPHLHNVDKNYFSAKVLIDKQIDVINDAMTSAALESGCNSKQTNKPKHFWCPELGSLRDQKRFWWALWVQCGRPRDGEVFRCWKSVKKKFRKCSRQYVNNISDNKFQKISQHFNERRMTHFWNCIKTSKRKKILSSISAQTIADYYSNIMKDDGLLNEEQSRIDAIVENKYLQDSKNVYSEVINTSDIERVCE